MNRTLVTLHNLRGLHILTSHVCHSIVEAGKVDEAIADNLWGVGRTPDYRGNGIHADMGAYLLQNLSLCPTDACRDDDELSETESDDRLVRAGKSGKNDVILQGKALALIACGDDDGGK